MNLLVNNEANECVALLINALPACQFKQFIECVNRKENWTAELCWCFFEKSDDNKEYYHFQTFENDSYIIHYNYFLDIEDYYRLPHKNDFQHLDIFRCFVYNEKDRMHFLCKKIQK